MDLESLRTDGARVGPSGGVDGPVAFVLGGGGLRGAAEVGMAKALVETDLRPDAVYGTSIGSINGAVLASREFADAVDVLTDGWSRLASTGVLNEGWTERVTNMVRHRTHLHTNKHIREVIESWVPHRRIEQLPVRFECSAACIETSSEHWFTTGPLVDSVLASCAVPSLLPPVEIGGRHYLDGGVVNSIPISRAIERGAGTIIVLHVGNIDTPLRVPKQPWDIAFVSFEISRRHRFHRDLATLPDDVIVHVLPTGSNPNAKYNDLAKLRYNRSDTISQRIAAAYDATRRYLARHELA